MTNPGGFEGLKARSSATPDDVQMMAKQIQTIISKSEQQSENADGTADQNQEKEQIVQLLSEILPLLNTVMSKNNNTGQQA